jgi:hypothetical protein
MEQCVKEQVTQHAGRKRPRTLWKRGKSGNPKGRPKGAKNRITEAKIKIIARTGMMPLDFLTAVYRDELYDRYISEMMPDGRTMSYRPAPNAKRIKVGLPQRIVAATNAAPYVHRKMPIGVEVTDKNQRLVLAQRLAELPSEQLEMLAMLLNQVAPEQQEPKLIGSGEAMES